MTRAAFLAVLLTVCPAAAQDIVPIPEAMKQDAPTSYALVRCAGVSRASAVAAAERAGEKPAEAEAAAVWTARFAASGRVGDAAWKTDPLRAEDMTVCAEFAAAAR